MYRRLAAALLFISPASAEEFRTGPLIEGYGPAIAVADKDVAVDTVRTYRLVFDAGSGSPGDGRPNPELESAARFLNMQAANGVPAENMELAIVVHGEALMSVLNHDAYQQRFRQPNPSLDLLERLVDAGVDVYVCGQSMGFRNVEKAELSENVAVGLSAMTLLATHQDQGYALIP